MVCEFIVDLTASVQTTQNKTNAYAYVRVLYMLLVFLFMSLYEKIVL
jgi:hypothetical protein